MRLIDAEIILKWNDGKTVSIGTLEMEADKDGMVHAKIKHVFLRLGWELVRKGMWLMFCGRKYEE